MFKRDTKSLEMLSFEWTSETIANWYAALSFLAERKLFEIDDSHVANALTGLEEITRLKQEGKFYAFHVTDSYTERQEAYSEGVELYLRQGNRLVPFYQYPSRDRIYQGDEVAEVCKKREIKTVYTGDIPFNGDFLGLPDKYVDSDGDEMSWTHLNEEDTTYFTHAGIEVISLDSLL